MKWYISYRAYDVSAQVCNLGKSVQKFVILQISNKFANYEEKWRYKLWLIHLCIYYLYPMIAKQILDDYKIADGKCLDIGNGYLGLELSKITNLGMFL